MSLELLHQALEVLNASPEFGGKVQVSDGEDIAWVGDCSCPHCHCGWACLSLMEDDAAGPHLNLSFHRDAHPCMVASLARTLAGGHVVYTLSESWRFSRDGDLRWESDGYRRPR